MVMKLHLFTTPSTAQAEALAVALNRLVGCECDSRGTTVSLEFDLEHARSDADWEEIENVIKSHEGQFADWGNGGTKTIEEQFAERGVA